jgi:N-acetylglucosaminyldiphosphoundecaprenol N-acetyl-beta-D-mannosaminyltransferase
MKKQSLLNIFVNNVDWEETVQAIDEMIAAGKPSYIVEINVDVLLKIEKDPCLQEITRQASLTLVDGKPLIWIARWQKRPVKAKISGSDLAYVLCRRAAEKRYSIFILGGADGVAETAGRKMKEQFPELRIAGTYAPAWGFERDKEELERINEKIAQVRPDLLFVCFGCPKQEKWVYENYRKCGATVCLCAGAAVDFLAGRVKRAPKWMSACGLEWFYRFLKEPRRLFRRYFIDDMKIVRLIWRYRRK